MKEEIGITAGKVWEYIYNHGTVTAIKLKSELGISNTMLYLALGWLAREDKIEVTESDHSFKISLKQ
jgi:Winged helix-turn-helix domain (DUF2582)